MWNSTQMVTLAHKQTGNDGALRQQHYLLPLMLVFSLNESGSFSPLVFIAADYCSQVFYRGQCLISCFYLQSSDRSGFSILVFILRLPVWTKTLECCLIKFINALNVNTLHCLHLNFYLWYLADALTITYKSALLYTWMKKKSLY